MDIIDGETFSLINSINNFRIQNAYQIKNSLYCGGEDKIISKLIINNKSYEI